MRHIIIGIFALALVTLPLAGCGSATLDNVSVEYFDGRNDEISQLRRSFDPQAGLDYFLIYKDPGVVYENVELVLNHKYTLGSFTINDDGPWIHVWVDNFIDEDSRYFNSAEMKPTHFKISCDLANGKRGEYIEVWE